MEEVMYIPGDLVKIKPSVLDEECDEVFQIVLSSRENPFVLHNVRNNKEVFAVQKEQINPIPLTEKILEANGWVWISNEYRPDSLLHLECKLDIEVTKENGCEVFFNYNYENTMILNYVHQLQHLLFGLGLNSELKV